MSTVGDDVPVTEDLAAWLRRCYDDDERLIDEYERYMAERGAAAGSFVPVVPPGWQPGEPFDPDRQRADLAVKRRILDEHPVIPKPYAWAGQCERCVDGDDPWDSAAKHPCPTVKLLALPYADRPGYQESWRP